MIGHTHSNIRIFQTCGSIATDSFMLLFTQCKTRVLPLSAVTASLQGLREGVYKRYIVLGPGRC